MALMPIPRHEPVDGPRMAAALRGGLARPRGGRLWVRADARLHPEIEGHRWTRVPFFKVVLSGRLLLRCDEGERGGWRDVWLRAGDAVLFAAGSHANVDFPESVKFLRVTFDADLTFFGEGEYDAQWGDAKTKSRGDLPVERLLAHVRSGARPALVEELLAALGRCGKGGGARERGKAGDVAGRALVDALLWSLAESLEVGTARETGSAGEQRRREILRYMEEQCGHALTREGVARAFGVSGGHLTRVFQERGGGEGFQAALLRLRLARARDLLRHSALTIEEVALRCGFTSANYFAQAFRRVEGVAPRVWRRRG